MNRGRIVEQGPAEKILQQPEHETTRQLLAAVPRITRAALPAVGQ
jgi:peptide/nickel transport system ATP-binding protein